MVILGCRGVSTSCADTMSAHKSAHRERARHPSTPTGIERVDKEVAGVASGRDLPTTHLLCCLSHTLQRPKLDHKRQDEAHQLELPRSHTHVVADHSDGAVLVVREQPGKSSSSSRSSAGAALSGMRISLNPGAPLTWVLLGKASWSSGEDKLVVALLAGVVVSDPVCVQHTSLLGSVAASPSPP